jgi:hypothetical protein
MSEKFSGEEVSKRALDILQSSDFTKTLESFNAKCIKPTMNIMAKKIVKAKKKLKKLQKRQRKQDKYGVISAESYVSQNKALIEKVGEVMLDGVKDIYGNPCVIKPVITLEEFIKFRDKMARPS